MEILRAPPAATHRIPPQTMGSPPGIVDPVRPLPIQSASETTLKRHAQRLRAAAQKRTQQSMKRGLDALMQTPTTTLPSPPSAPPSAWEWVSRLLRAWIRHDPNHPCPEGVFHGSSAPWWHEMDADIAWSLTHYLEQCMGVPASLLTDSVGLRTLLQRHLQWIQFTPEWMQLVGLLLAKRWRHRCGGSGAPCVEDAAAVATTMDSPHPPLPTTSPCPDHPDTMMTVEYETEEMTTTTTSGATEPPPTVDEVDPAPVPPPVMIEDFSVRSVEVSLPFEEAPHSPPIPPLLTSHKPKRPRPSPLDLTVSQEEEEEAKPRKKKGRPSSVSSAPTPGETPYSAEISISEPTPPISKKTHRKPKRPAPLPMDRLTHTSPPSSSEWVDIVDL